MASHVELGQLDTDSKDLNADDDSRGFLENGVAPFPAAHGTLVVAAIDIANDGS